MKLAALVASGQPGQRIQIDIVHLFPSGLTEPRNSEPCKRLVVDRKRKTWGISNPMDPNAEVVSFGKTRKTTEWDDVLTVIDLENIDQCKLVSRKMSRITLDFLQTAALHE